MKLFPPFFNRSRSAPVPVPNVNPVRNYPSCQCFDMEPGSRRWKEVFFHQDIQDKSSEAWTALEEYIDRVRRNNETEFDPIQGIGIEKWETITELPPSIGSLQSVKFITFYGSHLVRVPPEIGELSSLEEFDVYTSYCLHWLPYEITRCTKLKSTRASTRALYGNYKYRPPFPQLPSNIEALEPAVCSICRKAFDEREPLQAWISLLVGTDVFPLLVHACSDECLGRLPTPREAYLSKPHCGGPQLQQPSRLP